MKPACFAVVLHCRLTQGLAALSWNGRLAALAFRAAFLRCWLTKIAALLVWQQRRQHQW